MHLKACRRSPCSSVAPAKKTKKLRAIWISLSKAVSDDDRLVVKRTIDAGKMLQEAIRPRGITQRNRPDHKLVGTVGMPLVHEWLKEAGVSWSDTHAVQEVISITRRHV